VENADGLAQAHPVINTWWGSLIDEKTDASGLKYMRNRYYNPRTGQFTQQDPIGLAGGLNLYGFGDGDPINFGDPFGLCPPESPWTPECDLPLASAGMLDPLAWLSGGLAGGMRVLGARLFGREVTRWAAIPKASNPALQNTVRALFRRGDDFAGGTAGAIRNEAITGQPTKGIFHLQKGIERIANLKRILGRERLDDADRATAKRLLDDLQDAVRFAQERAKQR
jgi:RHS repeat-associated protein